MVTFDSALPGTSRDAWEQDERFAGVPAIDLTGYSMVLVFAAHPDDETLGAGGLIARCASAGIPVRVICVTDGAASHTEVQGLAGIRKAELHQALRILQANATLDWLGFPDGQTEDHVADISAAIGAIVREAPPESLVIAPWRGDGHPDHRVVGELAAMHASERSVLEYPIWMWHWASPRHPDMPWNELVSVSIDADVKQRAINAYASQTQIPVETHGSPLLRSDFLEHFQRPVEYFVASRIAFDAEYFDALYAGSKDPWSFRTRWYESRKRAITVAALTRDRFKRGLEIGCSVGHLTELLAPHCDSLLAVDISSRAIDEAQRTPQQNVEFAVQDVLAQFPEGRFDLIVLSEVGYYWNEADLRAIRARIHDSLEPEGILLACHWRHPVEGHRLSGDHVHEILNEGSWTRGVTHIEEDFLLEVFGPDPRSVATQEGLS